MSPIKKTLISFFILINFLAMVRVHLPLDNKFFANVYKPIDPILSFFSIYQSWTMFSPDPARTNVFVTAEIKFDDGSKETYMLPRNTDLSLAERYIYGERFRVLTENIRRDDGSFLWRDVSKFALRQVREKNFNKIPLKVDLVRHWNLTPSIKQRFIPHSTKVTKFQSHKFYTHEVL